MIDNKGNSRIEIFDPNAKVAEALSAVKKQQEFITWIIGAIAVAVAIGFIAIIVAVFAIFIDHQNYVGERYDEYIKLMDKQGAKL
ncbi:MAG: hypothetical protein NTZ80_04590 [Patescibacteria group bacterium]|nr:hypothetical protein [Patescibacteria group bacterium]